MLTDPPRQGLDAHPPPHYPITLSAVSLHLLQILDRQSAALDEIGFEGLLGADRDRLAAGERRREQMDRIEVREIWSEYSESEHLVIVVNDEALDLILDKL